MRLRRAAALGAGALPVLTFPRAGLDWAAWVVLVPGLLLFRAAPSRRAAGVLGWWFGAGFLIAALYWTIPNIGPGLLLLAVAMGAPFGLWGWTAWILLRSSPLAAVVVLAGEWVSYEFVRSWSALGGPWALLAGSQWRHPAQLGLAAAGGAWLLSLAIVACNAALVVALTERPPLLRLSASALALATVLAGPAAYALISVPAGSSRLSVALVQPGVVHGEGSRFAAAERITWTLQRGPGLIVWGESSVGFDVDLRPDLVARLRALARAKNADLLVNEDAADARGRISKSAVLIGPDGIKSRYVKTRLMPFGEYIPMRPLLGWLSRVTRAAGRDRVPGTGTEVLTTSGRVPFAPLICFESLFPDLGRAVTRKGAQVIVYQTATSSFQDGWAPAQHASLGALRAAETGRPVVQAALTGVSTAYDQRGHRLVWFDTGSRGAVTVTVRLPATTGRTPYDRYGDWAAWLALTITVVTALQLSRPWSRVKPRSGRTAAVDGQAVVDSEP